MATHGWIHVWSSKKLSFKSTVCVCEKCNNEHEITTDQKTKEFLREFGIQFNTYDEHIKQGYISADGWPYLGIYFSDFKYENEHEMTKTRGDTTFYVIASFEVSRYTTLEHVEEIGKALILLHKVMELLKKYFPDQEFFYDCFHQDDEILPWNKVELYAE